MELFNLKYRLSLYLLSLMYKLILQESRAIAGRTARCRCKFRYVLKFNTGYSARSSFSLR